MYVFVLNLTVTSVYFYQLSCSSLCPRRSRFYYYYFFLTRRSGGFVYTIYEFFTLTLWFVHGNFKASYFNITTVKCYFVIILLVAVCEQCLISSEQKDQYKRTTYSLFMFMNFIYYGITGCLLFWKCEQFNSC